MEQARGQAFVMHIIIMAFKFSLCPLACLASWCLLTLCSSCPCPRDSHFFYMEHVLCHFALAGSANS
jgi:hypothetical protein